MFFNNFNLLILKIKKIFYYIFSKKYFLKTRKHDYLYSFFFINMDIQTDLYIS
jgi:hypothetical protein